MQLSFNFFTFSFGGLVVQKSRQLRAMASFIDSLVADIRKVSEESEMKELAAKLISQEEQLNKVEVSMLDTIIECLDINSHTLGILAAL